MITNRNAFLIYCCYGLTLLRLTLAVIYTDQWAVHIRGGREVADEIANRHDYVNLGPIVSDYYHFQHRKVAKRSTEPSDEHNTNLLLEPNVLRAQQQELKRRVKRDLIDTRQSKYRMNDPLWPQMWYLNRGNGLDMNVQAAWNKGVTGKGVVVTILDDGLEKDHPDIKNNYDALASYDVNNHDEDPQPRYDFVDSNRHGTRCAGEVAADANNSICAVGIAYEAKVGGVRMLDGDVTDAVEARSLSLNPDHIHVYSASWGPDDDGKTVDGPGELATRAFMDGILHGRNGLGSIFVWASGNGGRDHDNCNCDGYTNSIWTLSISSATENGLVPWYSEACSSTLATTYSSGSVGEKQVVTTDLHYSCTSTHTGTSASAPLAAGVCALALQVNPKLTWRDMQHIVVRTARPANLKASDWQTNGAGLNVSHSFGYGLMDAAAMVDLARNWTTVPPQEVCEIPASHPNKLVPAKSKVILPLYVDCPKLHYLEHVQAKISMSATRRGDIQIFLKSPSGTSSCLLDTRPHDTSPAGFHNWPFMTVHNWGENPEGIWMLEIHNEGRYEGKARLKDWLLVLHGTSRDPGAMPRTSSKTTTTTSTSTTRRPPAVSNNRPKRPPKRPSYFPPPPPSPTTVRYVTSAAAISASTTTAASASVPLAGDRVAAAAASSVPPADTHFPGQGRHSNAATITNWNMVVYGTKGNSELTHNDATSKVGLGAEGGANGSSSSGGSGAAKVNTEGSSGLTGHDGGVHRGNVISVASSANLTCVTTASESGQCLECVVNLFLLNGQCVSSCPAAYFSTNIIAHQNNSSILVKSCLRCHYTCKSCVGPNDYQCLGCFGDAQLESSYCRSTDLLHRISDIRSYAFAITISAIVFGLISVVVVAFFICWPKRQSRDRLYSALPQISGNLLVPPREKTRLEKGFLDLEDPTEDSQDEI